MDIDINYQKSSDANHGLTNHLDIHLPKFRRCTVCVVNLSLCWRPNLPLGKFHLRLASSPFLWKTHVAKDLTEEHQNTKKHIKQASKHIKQTNKTNKQTPHKKYAKMIWCVNIAHGSNMLILLHLLFSCRFCWGACCHGCGTSACQHRWSWSCFHWLGQPKRSERRLGVT